METQKLDRMRPVVSELDDVSVVLGQAKTIIERAGMLMALSVSKPQYNEALKLAATDLQTAARRLVYRIISLQDESRSGDEDGKR